MSVIEALEQDGKDVTVIDLDPNLTLEEQRNKRPTAASKTEEKQNPPNKHAALEALFGQRASCAEATAKGGPALVVSQKKEDEAKKEKDYDPPLKEEYAKFFKVSGNLDSCHSACSTHLLNMSNHRCSRYA